MCIIITIYHLLIKIILPQYTSLVIVLCGETGDGLLTTISSLQPCQDYFHHLFHQVWFFPLILPQQYFCHGHI
jgi:hypothetical protein